MQKDKYRQYTFGFLTKNVGKGVKNSLKRVKVVNQKNEVEKECHDRSSIEHEVSEHNIKHFRKACSSNAFKYRMHSKLKSNHIRYKILKGTLKRKNVIMMMFMNF